MSFLVSDMRLTHACLMPDWSLLLACHCKPFGLEGKASRAGVVERTFMPQHWEPPIHLSLNVEPWIMRAKPQEPGCCIAKCLEFDLACMQKADDEILGRPLPAVEEEPLDLFGGR